jgi:hypothetical protein
MFAEMTCYLPKLIYPVYPVSNQTNLAVPPREAGHLCLALPIFTQVMVQTIAT